MTPSEDIATATKSNFWRKVAAGCIVAAGVCLITALYVFGLNNETATDRDYIQYWSSGQLLDRGANPIALAILCLDRASMARLVRPATKSSEHRLMNQMIVAC